MELELQNLKSTEIKKISPHSPKNAFWEVVYDYSGNYSIFLTEGEKYAFLKAIAEGNDFVDIRGMVLSKRFLLIRFAYELKEKEDRNNSWIEEAKSTRKLVDQMEEHFRKVAEERRKHEAEN